MHKILVALDGKAGSERALQTAVRLAQRDGGRVTALTVLDRPADPYLERIAAPVLEQGRRRLEELLQTAVNFARSRGVLLTPILREGHPADAIISCAEKEAPDLLVLGASGEAGRRAGLGGTADQVSSHAPCTVMLVK